MPKISVCPPDESFVIYSGNRGSAQSVPLGGYLGIYLSVMRKLMHRTKNTPLKVLPLSMMNSLVRTLGKKIELCL